MLVQIALRTVFFYVAVVIVLRIMGKRELGHLSPFDLVVSIMIAELAALPIENTDKPLLEGVTPLVVLLLLEMFLSYAALKSETIRGIVDGKPSIVIMKGQIVEGEMRKLRYNLNDLLAGLRNQGIVDVADVDYAILEPSGILSVIPRVEKRPLTPADLKLELPREELPLVLITDGCIHWENVRKSGLDESSFRNLLQSAGVSSEKVVIFAYLDGKGRMQVQFKEAHPGNQKSIE